MLSNTEAENQKKITDWYENITAWDERMMNVTRNTCKETKNILDYLEHHRRQDWKEISVL